jgi:DNA-binding PadR family transcriptional regulator
MEYSKILDELLSYLITTNQTELNSILNETIEKDGFLKTIDYSTLHSALLKLVKDGYVNQDSEQTKDLIFNTPQTDYFYNISFEGYSL